MAISIVVFDLGGVVCRHQPELRLRELSRLSGRNREEVQQALYRSGFIAETEAGLWSAEEFVAEVGARLGRPIGRDELEPAWLASFSPDDDVVELVRRVATRYRTAILANNDLLLREALRRAHPHVVECFGDVVFSADVRAVKPSAESFRRALSIMKVEPAEVLFIDDSAANVAGAIHAGLSAIRFQDASQLAAELDFLSS